MVGYMRNPFHKNQKEVESHIWDILYERYSSQFDNNKAVRESNLPYRIPTESDVYEYLDCKVQMERKLEKLEKLNIGVYERIRICRDISNEFLEDIKTIGLQGGENI